MVLTEKYRPQRLKDVIGHKTAVDELKLWADTWFARKPKYKAVLIYGDAGVGKTSTAYALAHDYNYDVVEINASDERSKIDVDVRSKGLMMKKRMILFDEADNMTKGGEKKIVELIKESEIPIMLTANDIYKMSLEIRNVCLQVKFNNIRNDTVYKYLMEICVREGIKGKESYVKDVSEKCKGDLRAALNDLEKMIGGGSVGGSGSVRNKDMDVYDYLRKIFNGEKIDGDMPMTPVEMIRWIDANVTDSTTYKDLSRSCKFLERTKRNGNYGMWRYASILMTHNVKGCSGKMKYDKPKFVKR